MRYRANILNQEKNICNGPDVRESTACLKNTGSNLIMLEHKVEFGEW